VVSWDVQSDAPVGLAAATSAFLLGAAVVMVADLQKERLEQAREREA
jgi:glutathione-independent formaldehyde dehydrogenase